jgi:hypothetical protein
MWFLQHGFFTQGAPRRAWLLPLKMIVVHSSRMHCMPCGYELSPPTHLTT